jgi:hypothetical protein
VKEAMRPRTLLMAAIATLLIVSSLTARVAEGQTATGESYWGEHTLNGIFQTWPAVAIAVFAGFLAGGMLGLYELDTASVLFLLAGIAFLAYHFYWHPVHAASSFLRLFAQGALVVPRSIPLWPSARAGSSQKVGHVSSGWVPESVTPIRSND